MQQRLVLTNAFTATLWEIHFMFKKSVMASLVAAAIASIAASAAMAQATGPSSSATPYVTPTAPGWSVTSILTVGDSVNNKPGTTDPYRMVGIPDGLGAYDNGDNTFTVLMNHELGSSAGIARAHGAAGAFVSEWVVNKSDFRVLNGADLAQTHLVSTYNSGTWSQAAGATNAFNRLCSADLPAVSAFYNAATGLGTQSRIFMNGEEAGNEGRAYGFVATGTEKGNAYELPKLGKFSWENSVANPYSGDKTVVVGLDDSTPGQVYVYIGNKTNTGNEVQKAGLDNGVLYGIKGPSASEPNNTSPVVGAFSLQQVDNTTTGANLQTDSVNKGVTQFARPEDGHWADERSFYFVTTGSGSIYGKLYKVGFDQTNLDGSVNYAAGGTLSVALDSTTLVGTDGAPANIPGFDNITVTADGKIILQDDPGGTNYNAKTWLFDPKTGQTVQIFESDVARFGRTGTGAVGATAPFNNDEENSGVIDVTAVLGKNDGKQYFLGVTQAHYTITGELVQGGQLYVMAVPEPSTYALMAGGLGMLGWAARRRKKG